MDDLYKVQNDSGEEVSTPKTDLVEAAKQGYLPVLTNAKKEYIRVQPTELEEAEKNGYFNPKEVEQYAEENKGILGTAKVAGGQFLNQLAFGAPQVAANNLQKPIEVAKREALKEEHPVANVLGGLGGFAGSLALGGPLFEAAGIAGNAAGRGAADLVGEAVSNKLAQKAIEAGARLGTEGLVYASPQALTEAVTGNPKQAVEKLVAGGLGNIVLGGIISGTGALKNLVSEGNTNLADKLEESSYNEAAKEIGLQNKNINYKGGVAGNKVNPDRINDLGKQVVEEGISGLGKTTAEKKVLNEKLMDELGTVRKDYCDLIDDKGLSQFKPAEVVKELNEKLGNFDKGARVHSEKTKALENVVDMIFRKHEFGPEGPNGVMEDYLPINKAQEIVEELSPYAEFDKAKPTEANKMYADAYFFLRNKVNEVAGESAEKVGIPDLKQRIEDINNKFNLAYKTRYLLNSKLAKEGAEESKSILPSNLLLINPIAYATALGKNILEKTVNVNSNALAATTYRNMADALRKANGFIDNISPAINSTLKTSIQPRFASTVAEMTPEYFKKLNDNLDTVKQEPEAFINHIEPQSKALMDLEPQAAALYAQKLQQVAGYIQDAIPKNPNNIPTPFRKDTWQPSSLEVSKFNNVKNAALNPQVILYQLTKGILNPDSVKTVNDLYPEMMKQLNEKIVESLGKNQNLPYSKKLQLQSLIGTNYFQEFQPKNMQSLQSNLKIGTNQPSQQQPTVKPINVPDISTQINKSLYQK